MSVSLNYLVYINYNGGFYISHHSESNLHYWSGIIIIKKKNVFKKKPILFDHLFDQKYSKCYTIVKYYYKIK